MKANCNSCVSPSNRGGTHYKIQQLTKLERGSDCKCQQDHEVDIFPVTVTQAITDHCTGRKLTDILGDSNHIFKVFKGSFKATVRSIEDTYRHTGLILTYIGATGKAETYRYDGATCHQKQFEDRANWTPITYTPETYKPSNLRFEGYNLLLDVLDGSGAVSYTLKANIELPKHKCKCKGGSKVVNAPVVKGNCGTCVSSSSCGSESTTNTTDDNTSSNTEDNTSNPNGGGKTNEEIDNLKKVIDDLKKRLEAVEGRTDNDTVFDPSEINKALNDLKKKVDELAAKSDVSATSGEWIDDNTVRVHKSDGTHFDIVKPNTPVTPPDTTPAKEPLRADIAASRTAGWDNVPVEILVDAMRGGTAVEPTIRVNGNPYTKGTILNITEDTVLNIEVEHEGEIVRQSIGITVSQTNYQLHVTPEKSTINEGESVTIDAYIISNNPEENLDEFVMTINGQPYTRQMRVSPTENTTYTIVANNGKEQLQGSSNITVNKAEPKQTILYGFTRATSRADTNTAEVLDLNQSKEANRATSYEVEVSPEGYDFTHGFWSVAVPTTLLDRVNKVEIWFNGSYSELRSGLEIVNRDGHWLIKDSEINSLNTERIRIS